MATRFPDGDWPDDSDEFDAHEYPQENFPDDGEFFCDCPSCMAAMNGKSEFWQIGGHVCMSALIGALVACVVIVSHWSK
jgi:hypothetical protein